MWSILIPILASAASSAISSAMQPRPNSFNVGGGHGPLAAETGLIGALTGPGSMAGQIQSQYARGVTLPSSYAQAPPAFSGGGLPMPIGVTGQDPATVDNDRDFGTSAHDPWKINSLLRLPSPNDDQRGNKPPITFPGNAGSTTPGASTAPTFPGQSSGDSSVGKGKNQPNDAAKAMAAFRMMGFQ